MLFEVIDYCFLLFIMKVVLSVTTTSQWESIMFKLGSLQFLWPLFPKPLRKCWRYTNVNKFCSSIARQIFNWRISTMTSQVNFDCFSLMVLRCSVWPQLKDSLVQSSRCTGVTPPTQNMFKLIRVFSHIQHKSAELTESYTSKTWTTFSQLSFFYWDWITNTIKQLRLNEC